MKSSAEEMVAKHWLVVMKKIAPILKETTRQEVVTTQSYEHVSTNTRLQVTDGPLQITQWSAVDIQLSCVTKPQARGPLCSKVSFNS